jgi:YVTN family beta-propeller protein
MKEAMKLLLVLVYVCVCVFGCAASPSSPSSRPPPAAPRSPFIADNAAAMDKMMMGMAVTPTGDVDRDFVAMMSPHHQGAIDMAVAELRYGTNERLKRLAHEIIVTQQEEIAAMQLALAPIARAATAPATTTPAISHRDRVYAGEQFSNTVSVTDPADNRLLGVIRLGEPQPANFSPLYRGQVLVHGLGFAPDHRTIAAVSIASNSVSFIDTSTNAVKHITYVGRSPHEAFYTPDGSEVWVTVRGENYVSVIDAHTFAERARITVPNGPGMTIFSTDGRYGYVCSSFSPETVVIGVADHQIVGHVPQPSPFCPNIAASPDGDQVWFTLKDIGKTVAFDAHPPFHVLATLDTGPITNHVNFARVDATTFAYVSVGALGVVKVFRASDFTQVATIDVGALPHGVWPSGDGSRIYVGLENDDAIAVIDTHANRVIAHVPIGQAPQALVYVPDAVPEGDGTAGLRPLGIAGNATHLVLQSRGAATGTVVLFDQGLTQVVQCTVTGIEPKHDYALALAMRADGTGPLERLASFTANPAGAATVNAVGPIRQITRSDASTRRYLVVIDAASSAPVLVQANEFP